MDADAVEGSAGLAASTVSGTEEDLVFAGAPRSPLGFGCISPLAVASLFVKDEIAQPAQEVSFCDVPICGTAPLTAPVLGGGNNVSGSVLAYFRTRCVYTSNVLFAWSRISLRWSMKLIIRNSAGGQKTYLSLSTNDGHSKGSILFAQSSSVKRSEVTASAIRAAFRACKNGSRKDRANAAVRTFCLVFFQISSRLNIVTVVRLLITFDPRLRAILPRQIVVLVRMPGCSSFAVLARYLSKSPLMVRSDSLVIIVKMALTVCSRTTGATSVKPVT